MILTIFEENVMCLDGTMIENLNTLAVLRELEVVQDAKASCY
jgi:hypothetical protein